MPHAALFRTAHRAGHILLQPSIVRRHTQLPAAFEEVGIDLWPDDVLVIEGSDLDELRQELKNVGAETVHINAAAVRVG